MSSACNDEEKRLKRLVIPVDASKRVTLEECTESTCLSFMQGKVGGYLEAYPCHYKFTDAAYVLYVNDNGHYEGLRMNEHLVNLGVLALGQAVLARSDKNGVEVDLPAALTVDNWQACFHQKRKGAKQHLTKQN